MEKSRLTNIERRFLIGSPFCETIPNFCFTTVEAIDAIANYYKHNEEWVTRWHNGWETRRKDAARTIEIVDALGMNPKQIENIQCACRNLNLHRDKLFYEVIKYWNHGARILKFI